MSNVFLLFFLFSSSVFAESLSQSFPAGKGAKYRIKMGKDTVPIQLSIYVAGTRVDSVHIEYFMEAQDLISIQLWQQFEIGVAGKGPTDIRKGYILAKELKHPEIIPSEFLKGAEGGIQVNDFIFSDKSKLDKFKIGVETIEIAAGTTKATHYRTSNNGQTIDYWVSDDAKPLGLVMLNSKSEKNVNQNYSLELLNLIENVKSKIIPEQAVPISDQGKKYLAKPESLR